MSRLDSMLNQSTEKDAKEQAAQWIARLDRGGLTADAVLEFRAWLEADVRNLKQLEECAAAWDDLDSLSVYRDVFAIPGPKRWFLRSKPIALAAVVSMVAIAFWFAPAVLNKVAQTPDNMRVQTEVGQIRSLPLSDGSSVKLNTDSELEVRFTDNVRRVRLQEGEAYFDVFSMRQRPFVVETPFGNVTAIGTAFLVRLNEDSIKVTVQKGRVEVTKPIELPDVHPATSAVDIAEEKAIVSAGQTATIDAGATAINSLEPSALFRQLAWRDGMLIFEGEPLQDVIAEFNRYETTKVEIADPVLREIRLGGYFPVGDLNSLLESLETGFGIRVEYSSDNTIRLFASSDSAGEG